MVADQAAHFLEAGLNERTRIQSTLDYLAEKLAGSVYVEDTQGRLLYTSAEAPPDSWRADFTPFAATEHPRREKLLAEWKSSVGLYRARTVDLSLKEYRVLLALTYQGDLFAFVHIVSSMPELVPLATDPHSVKIIGDKLYIVIMGTMNALRRKYLTPDDPAEKVRAWPEHSDDAEAHYQAAVVHFGQISSSDVQQSIIDYASIAAYHTLELLGHLRDSWSHDHWQEPHILPNDGNVLRCAIVFEHVGAGAPPGWIESRFRRALEAESWRATVGISPPFTHAEEAQEKVQQADEIRGLAWKQQIEGRVYTQRDIGVEAFLFPLTRSAELRKYAAGLVNTLRRKDHTLLETLQVYIALDCNATRTADHFQVDRRTITYRLGRISETLGVDLAAFETKVLLYLALKATESMRP
ncbi:PucR family transcriptional regulator [Sediminivirga luteola]|uniref:PucR family transcriptional regulator n=1 Tax=Sediminivirga luteola TaxID=1774748 RepID=UPI001F5A37B1|nr:helix-turn-helix domain-containing protein [Sediminivirga luteola]MCI2264689.1 helix-turn-helix domain-containing protein [Sediminivirga luteola]